MRTSASLLIIYALVGLGSATKAWAVSSTFFVTLNGANEITGGAASADLDGSAVGSITLDSGAGGSTATASWNFTLANLPTPPVTDFHIHTGAANASGGVLIPFGVLGGDTLNATSFIGSRTGLDSTNMASVLANPGGFYLNMHNGEFSGGAIRAQVPEPASVSIIALLGSGLLMARRRSR